MPSIKSDRPRLDVQIAVRVTPEQADALVAAAEADERTIPDVVRRALKAAYPPAK